MKAPARRHEGKPAKAERRALQALTEPISVGEWLREQGRHEAVYEHN